MPDNEICIPYRSALTSAARMVTLLLFPLWGVTAPFILILLMAGFVISLPFLSRVIADLPNLLLILFALASFCAGILYLGIMSVLITGERELSLNEVGMSFPANFVFALGGKRQRSWQELSQVELLTDPESGAEELNLTFTSGHSAAVKLASFASKENIEQLVLGLEVWSEKADNAPELAGLLEGMKSSMSEPQTFTQLWEEQLNRRFSSTAFVPLQKEVMLQSGRFRILEPIAFGGLSAVYLAQLKSAETVVLKEMVLDDFSESLELKKANELFDREAQLLMKLSHRQIARVLDHFKEGGRSYLVLEHIAGQNLRNLVRQTELKDDKTIVNWALQIAEILQFIHTQNPPIIHRDVTPDNLVLRNAREVVLIDFGAANEFLGTATGTLVGKQSYISPEQYRGKPLVQNDIYSFGATLFFLLTAEDPDPLSQSRPSTLREGISSELDDLIAVCTEFDWQKRPASALELIQKLEQIEKSFGPAEARI